MTRTPTPTRRRRRRLPRPSARRLAGTVALLGVLATVVLLVIPVDAAFASDPLLRYGQFATPEPAATDVRCGAPVSNLLRRSEGPSFYSLARDDACRTAASRRAATAAAAGALVVVLGLIGVAAATPKATG